MSIELNILRKMPLFSDMDTPNILDLMSHCQYNLTNKGNYLYTSGDSVKYLHVICRGVVQTLHITPLGHEITGGLVSAGNCVNADDIAAFRCKHYLSARAVEDVQTLRIPITWIREIISRDRFISRLITELSDQLHRSHKEVQQHLSVSAVQLVACHLQELCVQHNLDPSGFMLPYPKALIASRLHMEQETFSRALKGLRSVGVVINGMHVSFTDLDHLKAFVCENCAFAEDCIPRAVLSSLPRQPK